ncbi:unnamed protein product [Cylicocyclus nassatus]|uniref:Uncharacterized protein n=1 Tax=Cylicocyclus nassatus TaxID=53992 RepID=A0AA36DLI3_CYLNA|nr:unnamed protein product [Cylicocyclus nassatus]
MNSMQAPQQLISVPMRMVSNGTPMSDVFPSSYFFGFDWHQEYRSDYPNHRPRLLHTVSSQQAAMVNALQPGNTALIVVQGPIGPMGLNASGMHQSSSGEMSVGEYLVFGMDEKGKAETVPCGTDSLDTAGDAPPALDRGEAVGDPSPPPVSDAAKSLDSLFVRKALAFRARCDGCGKPLVHYMYGFTTETYQISASTKEKNNLSKAKQATLTQADAEKMDEGKRKVPARTRRSATHTEGRAKKPNKEEPEGTPEHVEKRKQFKAAPTHENPSNSFDNIHFHGLSGIVIVVLFFLQPRL